METFANGACGMDIRRLAQHLNVSIGTVSRALNGKPGVHPETRRRALQAAADLGYVANQSGRSLRRGATNTIGFMVETGAAASLSGDTFFYAVIDAMNAVLFQRGYDLVVLPCHSTDDPLKFLSRVAARGIVDAMVITATQRQDSRISLLSQLKMPFVSLGRSETKGDHSWIDLDFAGAARCAVETLLAVGHRKIALALPDSDAAFGHYIRSGYAQALAAAGIPAQSRYTLQAHPNEKGGFALGKTLLTMPDRPTAVILSSESTTIGLFNSLANSNVRAGQDISVVSLRETPQMRLLSPTLASFRLSLADLGECLAGMVLDDLAKDAPDKPRQQIIWPMEYMPGGSVSAPRQG